MAHDPTQHTPAEKAWAKAKMQEWANEGSRAVHPIHTSRRSGLDRRASQFDRDQYDRNNDRPTDREFGIAGDRRADPPERKPAHPRDELPKRKAKGGLGPNGEPGLTIL